MLYFNQNFRTTILTIFTVFALIVGLNINGQEQSTNHMTPKGWLSSIGLYFAKSPESIVPVKQVEPDSVAQQLQKACNDLRYYCANTAADLDLSEEDRAIKIKEFVAQIDLLISNHKSLDLQDQAPKFYWVFRFPAIELLKLNELKIVQKYILNTKLSPQSVALKAIGSRFAFIGISNETIDELITENVAQISAGDQVSERCDLWRKLVEHSFYVEKPADVFLNEILDSNILDVVKWYTKTTHLNQKGLQHVLDMAIELDCEPKIIAFLQTSIIGVTKKQAAAEDDINTRIAQRVMWVLDAQNRKHRKTNSTNLSPETLIELAKKYLYSKILAELGYNPETAKVHYKKYAKLLKAELNTQIARAYGTSQPKPDSLSILSDDTESLGSPSCRSGSTGTASVADSPCCESPTGFTPNLDDISSVVERESVLVKPAEQADSAPAKPTTRIAITPKVTPVTVIPVTTKTTQQKYLPVFTYIIAGKKITGGGIHVPVKTN